MKLHRVINHLLTGVIVAPLSLATLAWADQPHTYGHPFRLFSHAHASTKGVTARVIPPARPTFAAASTASSSSAPISLPNPIATVTNITLNDLQNALKVSNAQVVPAGSTLSSQAPYNSTVTAGSDTRHGNCWAALIQFVTGWQNGIGNILPNQLGLATAAQTYFDDQNLVGKPLVPDYVVVNCALTVADLQTSFANLALAIGVKVAPLPALPTIP